MTREEKVEEFYSYFGKFCVRFEYVMTNVRGNIDEIFKQIGIKDYRYVLALLNKDTSHQLSDKLKTWTPDLETSGSFDLIIGNYHRPKLGEGKVVRTNAIEVSVLKSICSDLIEITVLQKEIADLIANNKPLDSIEINEIYKKIPEMKKKLTIKDIL